MIDRLYKLSGQEQKVIKITAFDLQLNPASTGLRFHKLDRSENSLSRCYVDRHDDAYAWASRRKKDRLKLVQY